MKLASLSLAALLLVTTSPMAYALPEITKENGDALARQIDQYLTQEFSQPSNGIITFTGITHAEAKGDHYEMALPILNAKFGDGMFNSERITATLTPLNEKDYSFVINLPNNFGKVTDVTNVPIFSASLTSQDVKGVWQPETGFLPKFSAEIGNLIIGTERDELTTGIRSLSIHQDNTLDDKHKLGSKTVAQASDISLSSGDTKFTADLLSLNSDTDNIDYEKLKEVRKKFADIASSSNIGTGPKLLEALTSIGGNGHTKFEAKNLNMINTPKVLSNTSKWGLSRVYLESNGQSTDDANKSNLSVSFGHEGFFMDPVISPSLGEVIPVSSAISIKLGNFPIVDLIGFAAKHSDQTVNSTPPSTEETQEIKSILAQAGMTIEIEKIAARSAGLSLLLNGNLAATPTASMLFTGTVNGKLIGLDELVAKINQFAEGKNLPTAEKDPTASGVAMAAGVLQMQGKPTPNVTPSERTYEFEMNENGSLKLNGIDLSLLLGVNNRINSLNQQSTPPMVQQAPSGTTMTPSPFAPPTPKQPEVNLPAPETINQ